MTKVQEGRMSFEGTLVKVFEREFDNRKFYKARVIDPVGDVFDLNVQDSLIKEKPQIMGLVNVPVTMQLKLTSGQFNRATPIVIDYV